MKIVVFCLSFLLMMDSVSIYADYSCLAPRSINRNHDLYDSYEALSAEFTASVMANIEREIIDREKRRKEYLAQFPVQLAVYRLKKRLFSKVGVTVESISHAMEKVYKARPRFLLLKEIITPLDIIDELDRDWYLLKYSAKKEFPFYVKDFHPDNLSSEDVSRGDEDIFKRLADVAVKENKALCIGGMSAHGKSTFTKELALYLKEKGYEPLIINSDDYFYKKSGLLFHLAYKFVFSFFPWFYVNMPRFLHPPEVRELITSFARYKAFPSEEPKLTGPATVIRKDGQLELKRDVSPGSKSVIIFEGISWIDALREYNENLPIEYVLIRPNMLSITTARFYNRSSPVDDKSKTFKRIINGKLKSEPTMPDFPFKRKFIELGFRFFDFSYFKRIFWNNNKYHLKYILINNDFKNRVLFNNTAFLGTKDRFIFQTNFVQNILQFFVNKIQRSV